MKVQTILDLPAPSNLLKIQKIKGKANFLRRFITNYTEMAKGFARLLKKGIPFHWDEVVQASFGVIKFTLIRASLIYPPNYQSDYFMYLAAADTTIAMVLVQEEDGIEHLIYYLSHNLNDMEVKYSYVENLALASVQVVQRFHHYILF